MNDKKATADQVDWAMSLAIFLMFVVWFFLIVKPFTHTDNEFELATTEIRDEFRKEVHHTVYETPIYVIQNSSTDNLPIMISKPRTMNNFSIGSGRYYETYKDRLIFLAVVEGDNKIIRMRRSTKNYSMDPDGSLIRKTGDAVYIDSRNYSASFKSSMAENVLFNELLQIKNSSYQIDTETMEKDNPDNKVGKLYALFNTSNNVLDIENFVFYDNPLVFTIIRSKDILPKNYTLGISYSLNEEFDNYDDGNEISTLASCIDTETSKIDFRGNNQGITFLFDHNISVRACPYGNRVQVDFETMITPGSTLRLAMVSHNKEKISYLGKHLVEGSSKTGITEKLTGISEDKLVSLREISSLKERWNLSDEIEFEIQIFNSSNIEIYSLRTKDENSDKVYARRYRNYLLEEDGSTTPVFVNIKTW